MDKRLGVLTGFRWPECGCCLYANLVNDVWCSKCVYRIQADRRDDRKYYFVSVPDEKSDMYVQLVELL